MPLTVFRAGALGDFVVTLPALHELFAQHGALRIVGNRAAAHELAPELFAAVDSIDDPRWAGLFHDDAPLPEPDGEAIVLLRDGGAAERLRRRGWTVAVRAHPFPSTPDQHVAAHLLAAIGKPHAIARRRGATHLHVPKPAAVDDYLAVHPGSGSPRKNWSVERFAEVLREIDFPSVVVGGPADDDACSRLLRLSCASVAVPPSLSRLAAILAGAALYWVNDSGVSHVAAALGVPTVAVFGPTRAARWAPWGPRVEVVEPTERCVLCVASEERPAECDCIESVSVDDVLAAVRLAYPAVE